MAVPRVRNVNPTRLTCRKDLNGDARRYDVAFVPDDMRMVTTGIDKSHPSSHITSVNVRAGLWLWRIDLAVRLQRIMRNELDNNGCRRFG